MRRRVPAIAVTLLAPVAIYFVVRSAALTLSTGTAAAAGAYLPPTDHRAAIKMIARTAQVPGQKVTPQMLSIMPAALLSSPTATEPFIVAAKAEEQAGRLPRAVTLLEEVKRRRPNRLSTRVQLALPYGRLARHQPFISEVDWLLRRSGRVQELVLPQLVKAVADPRARKPLAELLAKAPPWREQFYRIAAEQRISPQHAAALLAEIKAARPTGSLVPEYRLQMDALLAAGQYRAARAAWAETLPKPPPATAALLVDGEFKGGPPSPPFDWILHDGDVGRASIATDPDIGPHLEVEYFGGKNAVLAEQLLTLAPGAHVMEVTASSPAPPKSGTIGWHLTCLPGPQQIARLELQGLAEANRVYRARFVVPASGCSGQKLQLLGEAGDYSGASNVALSKMTVRRGD